MLEIWIYSITSVLIVSLISLIGLITISVKVSNLKKILIYLVSFSTGALFGGAFFHLLPDIVERNGFTFSISFFILLGILIFFIIEKLIYWHHCHLPITKNHVHPFSLMILIGDGFHNFLDGLIIGASYLLSIPTGIAATIAIALHEIPQEIGDFGILLHGGFSKTKALLLNFLSALIAVIGVIIALVMNSYISNIESFLIPLAVGGFIYIAGADLIPELHKEFEFKKSILQILAFSLGILAMILLLFIK